MCKPKRKSRTPTLHNRTAMSTLMRLAKVLTTTRPPSSDLTSPSPTKKSSSSISSKCTTPTCSWEQQPINIKTDYDLTKHCFELKVKAHDTYIQNSSSSAAGHNKYESANNMADIGNKIKDYIVKIASTSVTNDDVVAYMCEADKKKDAEMAEMYTQIKQLTVTVTKLASWIQQKMENNDPDKYCGRHGDRIVEQMTKLRNMGGYCSTHGFHPVGPTHDSVTCQFKKKDKHNNAATWNNRLNGNIYWPKAIPVTIEQHNHPTWKGKDKPN